MFSWINWNSILKNCWLINQSISQVLNCFVWLARCLFHVFVCGQELGRLFKAQDDSMVLTCSCLRFHICKCMCVCVKHNYSEAPNQSNQGAQGHVPEFFLQCCNLFRWQTVCAVWLDLQLLQLPPLGTVWCLQAGGMGQKGTGVGWKGTGKQMASYFSPLCEACHSSRLMQGVG